MTIAPSLLDLPPGLLERTDLTVDDVAHLPEDLRYELINGRLVLTPTATFIHQRISNMVVAALEVGAPDDCGATSDQSIKIDDRNELVPDVVVVEEGGADRSPILAADVLLAVEIISPSSVANDRQDKLKQYADVGIPSYWIIDPLGDRVDFTQYLLAEDGSYQLYTYSDGLVTVDIPWEVTLDLPAYTRRRDRVRSAARARRER